MAVLIAKTSSFCPGCGVEIEPRQPIARRADGATVHRGRCEQLSANTQTDSADWFLSSDAPALELVKPENGQMPARFAPVSLDQPNARQRGSQRDRILDLLSDGRLRTLSEIWQKTNCLPTSISIRLREAKRAGEPIVMRRIPGTTTYLYGLQINGEAEHGPRAA